MNSLDINHSFFFQEGKDSLSRKQEAKCLAIWAHFSPLPQAFHMPLSQLLVPTLWNAVVQTRPWLLHGLLSNHIYSNRKTLVTRKRKLIKPRKPLKKSTFLSCLLIKKIRCRAVSKLGIFLRIVLVCVDVKSEVFLNLCMWIEQKDFKRSSNRITQAKSYSFILSSFLIHVEHCLLIVAGQMIHKPLVSKKIMLAQLHLRG